MRFFILHKSNLMNKLLSVKFKIFLAIMKWVWIYYSVSSMLRWLQLWSKYMAIPSVRREIYGPPYIAEPLTAIPASIPNNADTESHSSIISGGHRSSVAEVTCCIRCGNQYLHFSRNALSDYHKIHNIYLLKQTFIEMFLVDYLGFLV